ncbi:MAG: translation initiation factor [Candidatus Coatesbacteria bacterium]
MENLRLSLYSRAGKKVTLVTGFTRDRKLMDALASELKRALAVGGTWRQGVLELQGDERDRVRPLLKARGFTVRG